MHHVDLIAEYLMQLQRELASVDTAVAHLAAGAGRPVQLQLANSYDWRWKGDPLWYPQLSLM